MKNYLVLLFFLIFSFGSFAYEVKWSRSPTKKSVQKEGVVKMTSSNAFLISKVIPIKKIVSIVDVEINKNKKDKKSFCDENFFPAEELNIQNIKKTNLNGIHFVRGFWKEGYKYVVAACAETKNGFKTSTAFVRIPFYKRVINQTQLNQLYFFKKDLVLKPNEKTSYIPQNNTLKNFLRDLLFTSAYAQISPPSPPSPPMPPSLDDLVDQLDEANDNVTSLRKDLRRIEGKADGTLGKAERELDKFYKKVEELRKDAGDAGEIIFEQSEKWAEIIDSRAEDFLGAQKDWQQIVTKTLSPGNFFKIGMATAAGAAIGSFGVNAVLNGISTGVSALVDLLDVKGRSFARGAEVDLLRKSLEDVSASLEKVERDLDRLVMNLPIVQFFSKYDHYEKLEEEIEKRRINSGDILEEKLEEYRAGKAKQRLGEQVCGDCLDKTYREYYAYKKELEGLSDLEKFLNIKKHINLKEYCGEIKKSIANWHQAELLVKQARARLLGKKDRSSFIEYQRKAMKKELDKSRKAPLKAIDGIVSDAKRILKDSEKSLSDEFKKIFNKGEFKKENKSCKNEWCRSGGLNTNSSVSCSNVIIDIQDARAQSGAVAFPKGMENLALEKMGFKQTSVSELSDGEKLELLNRYRNQREKDCFQHHLKKHYSKDLEKKVACSDTGFKNAQDFGDLAKCSSDFVQVEGMFSEILEHRDNIYRRKEQLAESNPEMDANFKAQSDLLEAAEELDEETKKQVEGSNNKIFSDYPHFEMYIKYCKEYR